VVLGVVSGGQSGQVLMVAAHRHLVPRLKTGGAMPVLPPCAFIMHTRTAFLYHFMAFGKEILLSFYGSQFECCMNGMSVCDS
jgi:hypothetical protein